MRKVSIGIILTAALLVGCFCGVLLFFFGYAGPVMDAAGRYASRAVAETGAVNLVSAIYLNYRLFDTLFEILVFSVAVLGVRFYLVGRGKEEAVEKIPESQVVRISADLLFPLILLLGIYLAVFGHLSPGGGFSGGVVAGSGLLLCAVALGTEAIARRFHEAAFERLEWVILLAILFLAVFPIALRHVPLTDLLPQGRAGSMLSGGSILIYNLLIGFKVFIGTWVIIYYFLRHRGEI